MAEWGGCPKWEMAGFGARPRSRNSGVAPFTSSSESSLVCRNAPLGGHSVWFWRETCLQPVARTEDVCVFGSDRGQCQEKVGACPDLSTFVSCLPVLQPGNSVHWAKTKWLQMLWMGRCSVKRSNYNKYRWRIKRCVFVFGDDYQVFADTRSLQWRNTSEVFWSLVHIKHITDFDWDQVVIFVIHTF